MNSFEVKTLFNHAGYSLLKNILFSFDPEKVHNEFIKIGKALSHYEASKKAVSLVFNYKHPSLEQTLQGIKFSNPVGLSAGFDKNAELIPIMENVGFGFVEVGSITAKSCEGNPGVRLKRIIENKSLWVNLGLNNNGADEISSRLKKQEFNIPFGISIAKTNCKETIEPGIAIEDYIYSLKKFRNIGNYFTINVSCPNAFGGQPFSDPVLFESLCKEMKKLNIKKPIFVKFSPDLENNNVKKIISISEKYNINGFICSNLTKKDIGFSSGGMSGKKLEDKANGLLSFVYKQTRSWKTKPILIGNGGIFCAEDAYKKIKLGADLVQLVTGMIYQGPSLIGEINYNLVKLLKKDGYKNISEAVGTAN